MAKRITLEQWITEALNDADKGKPCSALSLVHLKGGVGTEEVHTKQIEGTTANFRGLAEFFQNKATAYAQDMTGVQSFRLLAFYGASEPQAAHTFTVFEGALTAGETAPWSKHEPTGAGLLAQLMKHNESLSHDFRTFCQGVMGMLVQQASEHTKEKAEMNILMRDVLLNMRKENHQMELEQLKFKRESAEREMLAKALPGLVNAFTGTEIMPSSMVDTQIIEGMALKVGPDDLKMMVMAGKLTQQEALVIAQRFAAIREETEKKKAAIRLVPSEDKENAS